MKVYWSRCGPGEGNFGDRLTPLLLEHFGIRCDWAPPEHADLIGVGSVLEKVPDRFQGVIWTSGLMHAHSPKNLPNARVVAVRGRLTLERLACGQSANVILGDGGLLGHLAHRPGRKRFKLGLVPHFVDAGDPVVGALQGTSAEITVVDVCRPPGEVIQAIGGCEHVLSSSLHGLVVADSLGVPNHWMELNHGVEVVQGSGFKYRDYYSVFGLADPRPFRPGPADHLDTIMPLFESYQRPGLAALQEGLLRSLEAFIAAQPPLAAEALAREQAEKEAWMARLTPALKQLAAIVPANARFIFADEDQLFARMPPTGAIPFLEKDGKYWGPPADDAQAIRELERLRLAGAAFVVFAWPAFWWLEYYTGLATYLQDRYPCLCRDEQLVVFDLLRPND